MKQILLISENRIFLKRVYQMIVNPTIHRIEIVPFSMDAFDTFYEIHADIVILDTTIFLSYEHLVEQFEQCNWNFHIILVGETSDLSSNSNYIWMSEHELSKEFFQEIFDSFKLPANDLFLHQKQVNFYWDKAYDVTFSADAYHIFLLKSYEKNRSVFYIAMKSILQNTSHLCTLEYIAIYDSTALCYIKRSSVKQDFHFSKLAQTIFLLLNEICSIIYLSHVNWKKMEEEIPFLLKQTPYFYFLKGICITPSEFLKLPTYSFYELKDQCYILFSHILNNEVENAKHILKDIYNHTIKSSKNFITRNYIRLQLNFYYYIFMHKKLDFNFESLEDEFEYLANSSLFLPLYFSTTRTQEILSSCVLLIYKQFQAPISLEGIANELNLNKIYLNKLFKTQFQKTILDTLLILRLKHAKFELIFTTKKISEIANDSGFSDAGYFGKVFKKHCGVSALEFRDLKEKDKEICDDYESFMEIS